LLRGGGTMLIVVAGLASTLMFCCGGLWVFLGPVNYFGCGLKRPTGITANDLVGTYRARDGGMLTLSTGAAATATSIQDPQTDTDDTPTAWRPYSSTGSWTLLSGSHEFGDIEFDFATSPGENTSTEFQLNAQLAGSRSKPIVYWYSADHDECVTYQIAQA
jgi:hypothetical protein